MITLIADESEQYDDSVRVVTIATAGDLDSFFEVTNANSETFRQVRKQFEQDSREALLKQMSKV